MLQLPKIPHSELIHFGLYSKYLNMKPKLFTNRYNCLCEFISSTIKYNIIHRYTNQDQCVNDKRFLSSLRFLQQRLFRGCRLWVHHDAFDLAHIILKFLKKNSSLLGADKSIYSKHKLIYIYEQHYSEHSGIETFFVIAKSLCQVLLDLKYTYVYMFLTYCIGDKSSSIRIRGEGCFYIFRCLYLFLHEVI